MNTQEPIRLTAFRESSNRRMSTAIDQQLRLSLGLAAILIAATLTVAAVSVPSAPPSAGTSAQAQLETRATRG